MNTPFIAVLMGSESDLAVVSKAFDIFKELNITFEAHILSAHRTPEKTAAYVKDAEQRGCAVFIAAAGLAAHLAGAVAANTIKPVIGIPMNAGSLDGLDALLATVQMPGGTPVATVSIGSAGAKNAAFLAAEILAINDATLTKKLLAIREDKQSQLAEQDARLQEQLTCNAH